MLLTARFDLNPNGAAVFNYDAIRKTSAANRQVQAIASQRQITNCGRHANSVAQVARTRADSG
jgi:hypothetical protein